MVGKFHCISMYAYHLPFSISLPPLSLSALASCLIEIPMHSLMGSPAGTVRITHNPKTGRAQFKPNHSRARTRTRTPAPAWAWNGLEQKSCLLFPTWVTGQLAGAASILVDFNCPVQCCTVLQCSSSFSSSFFCPRLAAITQLFSCDPWQSVGCLCAHCHF